MIESEQVLSAAMHFMAANVSKGTGEPVCRQAEVESWLEQSGNLLSFATVGFHLGEWVTRGLLSREWETTSTGEQVALYSPGEAMEIVIRFATNKKDAKVVAPSNLLKGAYD